MIKKISKVSIAVLLAAFAASDVFASKKFMARVAAAGENEELSAIVKLGNLNRAELLYRNKKAYLKSLSEKTAQSQKNVEEFIKREFNAGNITSYTKFYLINGFLVTGKASVIRQLLNRPEVQTVHENYVYSMPEVQYAPDSPGSDSVEWGVGKINANKVWDRYNFKGNNIRVGHLDTGVDPNHPDITGKIASWAEFNYIGKKVAGSVPRDSAQHGTHTAGIILGGNASGKYIGAAPNARLLSAMVINNGYGSFAQMIAGLEWVIDPDGNPNTNDGAQVVSMSLGAGGENEALVEPIENLIAAGILPVASIGNFGPGFTSSPGNIPSCFGVGSVDSVEVVSYFSSGGVVSWNYMPFIGSWTKPDVCAPGSTVKSALPGGGYGNLSGTSMACPFVAGTVALMLEANGDLRPSQIKTVLSMTAKDLGDAGKDSRYGWGLVNAFEAVKLVVSGDIPDKDMDNTSYLPPMAYIYSPAHGKTVWGEAVSIVAGASASTKKVVFQYKSTSGGEWLNAGAELTYEPFGMYWDVTAMAQGEYSLRAIAYSDTESSGFDNEGISITISPNSPDIEESGGGVVDPRHYHKRIETISPQKESEIVIADGTSVIIPEGTVTQNTHIEITNLTEQDLRSVLPSSEAHMRPIGIYRKMEFVDGTRIFPANVGVILPYPDFDNDGIVDGSGISSEGLDIYYLKVDQSGKPVQWLKVGDGEGLSGGSLNRAPRLSSKKSVAVSVNHFTVFAIMSSAPKADLEDVIVYPNPSYNGDSITFEGLTTGSRVRIYTVSGNMVLDADKIDAASYVWNLRNEKGEKVVSGVYFYLVSNKAGHTKKGKLAVIR